MIRPRSALRAGYRTIFAPSAVFETWVTGGKVTDRWRRLLRLSAFYLLNLVVFAYPITIRRTGALIPAVSDIFQNFAFLVLIALYVVVIYHTLLIVLMSSEGFFQSYVVLVYSSGVYLAALFTAYFECRTQRPGLCGLQAGGVLSVQWGAAQGAIDALVGALVVVTAAYFAYSLYLGARINHGAGRLQALTASVLTTSVVGWLYRQITMYLTLPLLPVEEPWTWLLA